MKRKIVASLLSKDQEFSYPDEAELARRPSSAGSPAARGRERKEK